MSPRPTNAGPVNRPQAWRIHPAEAARFAADGKRCETRKCRQPVAITTWRWWRSAAAGRFLVAEHLVCERHGTEFAARHHIGVDPPGEREARRLSGAETAALAAAGRNCESAGCQNPATCLFTDRYTVRGEPRTDEDLACDRHVGQLAERFGVSIPPVSAAGETR
ncbi:MAG TPA: hypothetical protein VK280_04445 [Streptosporangiaceae bacterium]|nr:hypothetical protein [Streptosporangiaceae bacterium]